MTNFFDVINNNKSLLSTDVLVNETDSTITANGNTFKVQDFTVEKIATALEAAKTDPKKLNQLNNLFAAKHIQLGDHLNNQKLLVVASEQFNGWYETNEANDFDFATEFALVDLNRQKKNDDINFLMSPDNPNVFCNYYAADGKTSFEIFHYKDRVNSGLLYQAETLDEVMAKYEKHKGNIPDPISINTETAVVFVELPDNVKAEVTMNKEFKGLAARYIYDVKLLSNGKESAPIRFVGDLNSLMELRDGHISYDDFGVTPADIIIQSDVLQSDIQIKCDNRFGADDIQKAIVQLVKNTGDNEYSKWLCLESDVSPYKVSFRVENPEHLEEGQLPNIDFQLKHNDGSYVATFESTSISPAFIKRILEGDNIFTRGGIDTALDEEMRDEGILDIPENEVRIEDYAVRYASYVGDCIEVHFDEVKERNRSKDTSSEMSI